MSVPSDKIKAAILSKQVIVSNLKVTSNNRLINEDIDVPKLFNTVADKISELSGVNHSKPYIDNFYFCTKFGETSAYLKCALDGKDITFVVQDKQGRCVESLLNSDTLPRVATILRRLYCNYVTDNKPVNNEIIQPKSEDNKQQFRLITLNSSQILHNEKKIAEENGLSWDESDKRFSIVDENVNIVLNVDLYTDVTFKNSKVNGFRIVSAAYGYHDCVTLEYCEMQYLEAVNMCPRLCGCIVYNTANMDNGAVNCRALSYINSLKINNYKNIGLENVLGNNVYAHNVDLVLSADAEPQYIHNIDAKAESSIYITGNEWTAENITLATKLLRVNINQFNKNTDSNIQRALVELNGKYTYPNLYMIVCNHFVDANEVEPLVDISRSISISIARLVWRCKFSPEIKLDTAEEFTRLYNAEIVQDIIPNTIKFLRGGIAITNNTNITFNNIRVAALYKSKTKNYMLGASGIFLLDNAVKKI